jgi:hypothetical protein
MKPSLTATIISDLKDLVRMYRKDGYIDEDCVLRVRYVDGLILTYPDQVSRIRFKNIENIWYQTADDSGDFTYDFIGSRETYDFVFGFIYKENPLFIPRNPLILGEEEDYGQIFEEKGKAVTNRGAA